jgi:serpin B
MTRSCPLVFTAFLLVFTAFLLAAGLVGRAMAEPAHIAQAESGFAFDLYDQISKNQGNFVFSPYSVSTAVGMVYAGARGETAAAIARALHVNGRSMQAFLRSVVPPVIDRQTQGSVHFIAANAAWLSTEFHYNPAYRAMLRDEFSAALKPMDFSDPRGASIAINRWVVANTEGQIHDIVLPAMFSGDTGVVLTNAVYFRADWSQDFDPTATKPRVFHRRPLDDVQASMMQMVGSFEINQADDAKILTMPYDGDASMIVVLPDKEFGLAALEGHVTPAILESWLAGSQEQLVQLALPRFSADSSFEMNKTLSALGMKIAFDKQRADFSGIGAKPGERLYIGNVLHKVHIDVSEKSTEAEAVSAVILAPSGDAPPPPVQIKPIPFIADHPFLYIIRANSSGAILFMGRLDDPAPPD